jgi:restriction endonuclease S subunit
LSKEKENTLKNRIFISAMSKLSGNRLDPYYYNVSFDDLIESISKGTFAVGKLSSITKNIDTGKTPPKSAYLESDDEDILPVIKAGSYSGDFIDIDKSDFVKSDFSGNVVSKGDIFILGAAHQAEYVGKKVYYLNDAPKQKTFFVGELVRISAEPSKCNSSYLFAILKTKLYMSLLNREKRGQTSHLYPNDVKNILLPIPPIAKQNEIAEQITAIRQEALSLKDKTKELLKKASEEIEEILLN